MSRGVLLSIGNQPNVKKIFQFVYFNIEIEILPQYVAFEERKKKPASDKISIRFTGKNIATGTSKLSQGDILPIRFLYV